VYFTGVCGDVMVMDSFAVIVTESGNLIVY
jgi:hypothetical protein